METFEIRTLLSELAECTLDEEIRRIFHERSAAHIEFCQESDPARRVGIARYARKVERMKRALLLSRGKR